MPTDTTKQHRGACFIVMIAVLCGLLVSPLAWGQDTKLGKFLTNLNHGLQQVNNALAGNAPLTGAKYKATGIPPQTTVRDKQAKVDVGFPQGRNAERVGLFNQVLPVVDKTIGVIRCMPYRSMSDNERAWDSLHPYEVDHGSVRGPGYMYGTPMAQMSYHDQHLCLAVAKVVVTIPAANAVQLEITYLATDSDETTRYSYLYRKNYRGVWQFVAYELERN